MRSTLAPFFATLFAGLGSVYAFNAVYATAELPPEIAARLAAEQGVDDVIASDNTLFQRGWIRARIATPPERRECFDLLVLGSSTTGTLASEMFPGRKMLNAWTGNFSIQDVESLSAMVDHAPCKPREILLGVDMWWTANPAWNYEGWQQLASDYAAYHASRGELAAHIPLRVRWDDFKENLSFERTMDTLRSTRERGFLTDPLGRAGVRTVHAGTAKELCATVLPREQVLRASDGHYAKCADAEESDSAVVKVATDYLTANIHNMGDWRELATSRLDRLAVVVAGWRAKGIAVVMVGMPYHPITWGKLTTDPVVAPNVKDLEERLASIARSSGVEYLSLRDPSSVPCVHGEFDDSHHPRPACTQRVAAKAAAVLAASPLAVPPMPAVNRP